MFKVQFRTGKDGRVRWFAVKDGSDEIEYSCFPNSFPDSQQAWEHAQWAMGASVTMVFEDPDEGFEQHAGQRDWN